MSKHRNLTIRFAALILCLLVVIPASKCVGQEESANTPVNEVIKESAFGKSLKAGKFILPAKEGWWNWGMAPIYDPQGKLHIFNSSIPYKGEKGMGYWQSKSIINHLSLIHI